VVDTLARAFIAVMAQPAMKDRFHSMGFSPVGSGPREYADLLRRETATWSRLLKTTNLSRE
jgi:tripartite-type tricarboxylate transporter receptor subunit TctC